MAVAVQDIGNMADAVRSNGNDEKLQRNSGPGIGGNVVPQQRAADNMHSSCAKNDSKERISERLGRPV